MSGKIEFYQGKDDLVKELDIDDSLDCLKSKISDLSNIKNLHFLMGAGVSSDCIPNMAMLVANVEEALQGAALVKEKELYETIKANVGANLESILGTLYSHLAYLEGTGNNDGGDKTRVLIEQIESVIYRSINIDLAGEKANQSLELYKEFYSKLSLRQKDLARVNVFTTNNDLLSETSLDYLNINYNNGFGGGLTKHFNPARFSYTYSRKIDSNLEKYEPLENLVYLYKLHGSINWLESEDNSFFRVREVEQPESTKPTNRVLIYPTPLKQNKSLGTPYTELIREFQQKLLLKNSVLFVMGYSFSDEHINNAIYQALASNAALTIFVFGNYPDCQLSNVQDKRIYRTFGEIAENEEKKTEKIHYFEYIVKNLLPDLNKDKDSEFLKQFTDSIQQIADRGNNQ